MYQTLEEILVTLEKTRDFVASLVGDAPLEVTSRSWGGISWKIRVRILLWLVGVGSLMNPRV